MRTDAKIPNYCDGSMSMLLKKQAPLSSNSMRHERIILNEQTNRKTTDCHIDLWLSQARARVRPRLFPPWSHGISASPNIVKSLSHCDFNIWINVSHKLLQGLRSKNGTIATLDSAIIYGSACEENKHERKIQFSRRYTHVCMIFHIALPVTFASLRLFFSCCL